jgi:hypothetical protein
MSGNNNTPTSSMYDDEQKKKQKVQPYHRKWSTHIFGYNIPYWIIVLVIVLIVYLLYSNSNKSMKLVKLEGPANAALGSAPTVTSPTSSMNVGAAASANVASDNVASAESTRKLQRELRELFSKY